MAAVAVTINYEIGSSQSLNIVCPECDAVNRVPAARRDDRPVCGNCHRALFRARPVELSGGNFERHVGRNEIAVVVDFWAPWCGPCKTMAPNFERACEALEPGARLARLDTDAEQGIAQRFRIASIPTVVIFRHGKEAARRSGAMGTTDIVRWVQANS